MKRVILMRHAKSSWKDESLDDFDRPLNKRGKRDLPIMSQKIKELGLNPQLIICSTALRAKKTAKGVSKVFPQAPIVLEKRLYEANLQTYISIINTLAQKFDEVVIIAHNPQITQSAEFLSGADIQNIPTSGFVVLECERFCKVGESGSMQMTHFQYPKMI